VHSRFTPGASGHEPHATRGRVVARLLLLISSVFILLGFVHLRADFPNNSPWMDWSKMTDEGWYGGAAIHSMLLGHWYLPGSFNPAVAMPVWPVMLRGWFAITGLSMLWARGLTMVLYTASLWFLWATVRRSHSRVLAALAVLLTAANSFCYAFDRLAVLEPVLVFWMMLGFWLASLPRPASLARSLLLDALLGLTLAAMTLTKATGVALVPAVLWLATNNRSSQKRETAAAGWQRGIVSGAIALSVALGVNLIYYVGFVKPHYLADSKLLFAVNGYNAHLSILPQMTARALRDGLWISPLLYPAALAVVMLAILWLHSLWRRPLFVAALLAMAADLAFIAYHTNFQPRYYLIIAMPMSIVLIEGLHALLVQLRQANAQASRGAVKRRILWTLDLLGAMVVVGTIWSGAQTLVFAFTPQYSFLTAAQSIAAVVRADRGVKPLLLSDSGDDISLFTDLPGLCDAYSLDPHPLLLQRYQPGWYAAWPSKTGNAMQYIDRLRAVYRIDEVARYQVFDDPTRNQLVLFRLTPR
jgi:hypothetical protein